MNTDATLLLFAGMVVLALQGKLIFASLSGPEALAYGVLLLLAVVYVGGFIWETRSKPARERKKRIEFICEIPSDLREPAKTSVLLGEESDLRVKLYLPDHVRKRHVHILGATGSGKTESVILNFLKQDTARGLGAIILDAKGDASFLDFLNKCVPKEKLRVFDLGSAESQTYDPLSAGTPLEAAQRLFASLTWSEEYYKSKAFSALQRMFQRHFRHEQRNPTLAELASFLESAESFAECVSDDRHKPADAKKEYPELSGLRDQINSLTTGHLATTLSPKLSQISFEEAAGGAVIYFRLQSLMSPQLVNTIGRLVISHLNYLAGTAHRVKWEGPTRPMIPTYLDEFSSFVCPEFADLISKARSAGMALHFSHQSIGDLADVTKGFLNRITDCSATKIVLRINDPDSADFLARSFGTRVYQKITKKVIGVDTPDLAESVDEGTQRDARQFRSAPDVFKTLPTGVGSVLISHGFDTPHGASTVFKIQFPKL